MWEAERERIVELQHLRRRQSRDRIVTRGRRRLLLEFPPHPHQPLGQQQPQGAAGTMATAAVPDDELALQLEGDDSQPQQAGRAVRGQTNRAEGTDDALMGLQQEAVLRGAVANAMSDAAGDTLVPADSTRRTNSPVGSRVRDIIDRRNAWRDSVSAESSNWHFGGARPRTRNEPDFGGREDRQRYGGRAEARIALSPRRAFAVHEDHGRFLAQRLERMERAEESREQFHRQDLRDQQRRHDEERENWRRQQDEMARQMQQLQQQLAAVRLQQQQLQPPQPPMFGPPPVPLQQNQYLMPPPPNPVPQPPVPQPQAQNQPPPQQPQPPAQPLVASPRNWALAAPQAIQPGGRMATPVGARTPEGFTPGRPNRTDDDYLGDDRRRRDDYIDRKHLKLRTFKGKDIESWKSLFDDFAEQFQWSAREKKLQLKAHVDDWIRAMFTDLPADTTAEEMMARLVSRFGVNMTAAEVENKLLTIERKSGEDLYSLADRVRTLANRAHLPARKKQALMRQTFFTALRGNPEMQHWVNMYDDHEYPDMNITLDLAIEWERQHGTVYKTEKVRQVEVSLTTATSRQSSDTGDSDSEAVNKIDYIPIKKMTSEEGRLLAKQNNEMVSLLRKQAYTVLDDKKPDGGRSFYRKSSDSSSRSSSSWSRSRRSRSRDKQKSNWRGRDNGRGGRWRSDERKQDRSKDNYKNKYKDKKKGKFDKKRRDRKDGRVAEVREDSPSHSEKSDASSQSGSESDDHSE